MHKRIATGLFVLIFILGVAIVFYHQYTDIQQLKQEAAEAEKLLEGNEKPITENKPPHPAREGYKMVQHGDHWHQIPKHAPDSWAAELHEMLNLPPPRDDRPTPSDDRPTQATHPVQTYKGPLTYHKELLETNPSEALRLLTKEMNHWSADYIPDIPADDTIATEYARVEYLKAYIRATDEVPPGVNPIKLDEKFEELHREHRRVWYSADGIINWQDPNNPVNRFTKLTWIGLEPPLRWDEDGMAHWQ
ncbi:MAG: hypothetical protein OXM61_03155 [Candidatus Poribacteria bacterium]|nr:hypothetical protein [Candidatus Poribacteria bacterium]